MNEKQVIGKKKTEEKGSAIKWTVNKSRMQGICSKRQGKHLCGRKNKTVKEERRRTVIVDGGW